MFFWGEEKDDSLLFAGHSGKGDKPPLGAGTRADRTS